MDIGDEINKRVSESVLDRLVDSDAVEELTRQVTQKCLDMMKTKAFIKRVAETVLDRWDSRGREEEILGLPGVKKALGESVISVIKSKKINADIADYFKDCFQNDGIPTRREDHMWVVLWETAAEYLDDKLQKTFKK